MARNAESHGFVADGMKRCWMAHDPKVRAEIEATYAKKLAEAGTLERFRLRRKMNQEIEAKLKQLAPPGALY